MSLSFKKAEDMRFQLSAQQQKEIRNLYQSVASDIKKELNKPLRVPSDAAKKQYLQGLQEQVNQSLAEVGKTTDDIIRSNALSIAESVVGCNAEWLDSVGLSMAGAYSWVPQEVVTAVATGQIYAGDWSLSGAIWSDVKNQQGDIQKIIAQGIAENKSAFDIGKDLETYVDPKAAKPWDWSQVYPGVRRQIDYSAQRLARTMVSHAYQQAFVRTTQKNPFVTKYKWEASNSDRTCELCEERDGKLFDKDDLPLDHPNGMCTFTAEIPDSMDQVADRLADWVNGADDPALDAWAKDMYGSSYKPQQAKSVLDTVMGLKKPKDIIKEINKSGWFNNKCIISGLDAESLQHITAAYQRIFDRYPSLVGKFPAPFVGTTNTPNAYASCRTSLDGYIVLNRAKWTDWKSISAKYAKDVRMGFHPEGTTAESIITHEFGHALDGYLARSGFVASDTGYASSVMIEDALDRSGMSSVWIGPKVSTYAKKNERECFAECFSQAMDSKDTCSLSTTLLEDLDKILGRK